MKWWLYTYKKIIKQRWVYYDDASINTRQIIRNISKFSSIKFKNKMTPKQVPTAPNFLSNNEMHLKGVKF